MKSHRPPLLIGPVMQRIACRGWMAGQDGPTSPRCGKRGGLHLRFSGSGDGPWPITALTSWNNRSTVTSGPTAANPDPLPSPPRAVATGVHL
jgi:hypothetical protein